MKTLRERQKEAATKGHLASMREHALKMRELCSPDEYVYGAKFSLNTKYAAASLAHAKSYRDIARDLGEWREAV